MERLARLLADLPDDLGALDDQDLHSLRTEIGAAAASDRAAATSLNNESVALLNAAVDVSAQIDAELSSRRNEAESLKVAADTALGKLNVAAAQRPALVRTLSVPARHRPRPAGTSRAIYGDRSMLRIASGTDAQFPDDISVGEALIRAANQLRHTKGVDGERIDVATMDWRSLYGPGADVVRPNASPDDNGMLLARCAEEHVERMRQHNQMRVASGGVSGPAEPRYGLQTWGVADRPLRDCLPQFQVARGEIVFNVSPTLEQVLVDTSAGAVGYVTSAQDAATATKNVQEIPAPTPTTVVVEALTLRWGQGNFADRFYPEQTKAYMQNGLTRFARHAETRRFNDIKFSSTHFDNTPATFGAWRDLKRCLLGLIAELKDRMRDPNLPIRCLMPHYVAAMCACDLTAQQPGDDAWSVTADDVRARLNMLDPSVNFTWIYDGNEPNQRLLTTPAVLGGGASSRSPGFDADVDFVIYPEGTFLYLDGGSLDLGILRDTVVSATNRFQTFLETWEAVAPLAPISYWQTISLCADGTSQAAATVTGACSPQGS